MKKKVHLKFKNDNTMIPFYTKGLYILTVNTLLFFNLCISSLFVEPFKNVT